MRYWVLRVMAVGCLLLVTMPGWAGMHTLSKARYLDKCRGAWAGQMIGVCYGAPYEFQTVGKMVEGPLEPWRPERIAGAIGQDDCYVEMTFLKALEQYGLNISYKQAGRAFADSKYDLWHANRAGRDNVRHGLMPPRSGYPKFNRHADDIDFQIEADLFGIVCPGLFRESNRLCDVFGHIMNYGDGVYGGMFVAGMYAAAYLEDRDVEQVVRAGLACIPARSTYAQCITDVLEWHKENPEDWMTAWAKVERKWQDDIDCTPGTAFNIDAKLNGAYVAIGLLYGDGDLQKTVDIAVRCGQDNDCNPSNAAGVLGCMKGYAALGDDWTGGIAAIASTPFSFTEYSFDTLIPACQRLAEAVIVRAGGKVNGAEYLIPAQAPAAPRKLEQWKTKKADLATPVTRHEMAGWNPAWRVVACGQDMSPGIYSDYCGRESVLILHPVSRETPAAIEADLSLVRGSKPTLNIETTSDKRGDFVLRVLSGDRLLAEKTIDGHGEWVTVPVDLSPLTAGKTGRIKVPIRIENAANGWQFEAGYFAKIEVRP